MKLGHRYSLIGKKDNHGSSYRLSACVPEYYQARLLSSDDIVMNADIDLKLRLTES